MASALPLSILLVCISWSCADLTSTETSVVTPTLVASPVPAPPLEDVRTTPSSPGIPPGLPPEQTSNSSLIVPERNAKSIRFSGVSGNEVDSLLSPEDELGVAAEVGGLSDPSAENETNPTSAFKGIVSECLWALSVACLQRKILIFVNRLSRRDRFSLLGDGVALVRVWGDAPAAISEDILAEKVSALASADPINDGDIVLDEEHLLDSLTQRAVDDLIYSHAIRLRLPSWIGSYTGARSISAVDVDLDDIIETGRQGRKGIKIKIKKKKKKGGGKQMMKKMMKGMSKMGGMMMTMLLGKVAVLAPFLKIISAIALKASALALLLSKILLVRSLFSGGFGGGTGGLSSIFSGLKGGLGGGSGTPSSSYGAPQHQPSSSYGAPQQQPSSSYGTPSYNPPSTSYGTPSSSYKVPSSSYGTPSSRPSSSYGAPSSSWSSAPTAPPAAPSSSYGVPATQNSYAPPSKEYGAPSGGGGSWSSSAGFSSSGTGGVSTAGVGSSSVSSSGTSSGGGGYIGGGAQWSNRRGWESYSVEATTEDIDQ